MWQSIVRKPHPVIKEQLFCTSIGADPFEDQDQAEFRDQWADEMNFYIEKNPDELTDEFIDTVIEKLKGTNNYTCCHIYM